MDGKNQRDALGKVRNYYKEQDRKASICLWNYYESNPTWQLLAKQKKMFIKREKKYNVAYSYTT